MACAKNVNLRHFFPLLGKILVLRVLPAYRKKVGCFPLNPPAPAARGGYKYRVKTGRFSKSRWQLCIVNCFSSCSGGVIITSEWEYESDEESITNRPISKFLGKYKRYKMIEDFPKDFKGSNSFLQKYLF